jgi:hypothetical protein
MHTRRFGCMNNTVLWDVVLHWQKFIRLSSKRRQEVPPTDNSFTPQSVLRQVHSLFQSEFSTMRYSTSSFSFQCPFVSLRLSSSSLRLLPVTSTLPSTFPSTTCFKRQFLRKMWPIQLSFLHCIEYKIFLSPHFKTFQVFPIYFPKCPRFSSDVSQIPITAWPVISRRKISYLHVHN